MSGIKKNKKKNCTFLRFSTTRRGMICIFFSFSYYLIILYRILSESMRWQFSSGKIPQALRQLTMAAKKNNVEIPDDLIQSFLVNDSQKVFIFY